MTAIISPLPYIFANGAVADASQVDANFAQIVSDVNTNAPAVSTQYHGCVVSVTGGTTTLPDSVDTPISFGATSFDTDSIHSNTVHPTRFTMPAGYNYATITVSFDLGTTPATDLLFFLRINGVTITTSGLVNYITGGIQTTFISIFAGEGNYVEIVARNSSGSAQQIIGGTSFAECRISA